MLCYAGAAREHCSGALPGLFFLLLSLDSSVHVGTYLYISVCICTVLYIDATALLQQTLNTARDRHRHHSHHHHHTVFTLQQSSASCFSLCFRLLICHCSGTVSATATALHRGGRPALLLILPASSSPSVPFFATATSTLLAYK